VQSAPLALGTPHTASRVRGSVPGLHKILFYFEAFVHESIILSLPLPPALPALLQYYHTYIAQYTTPPTTSRLYAMHHTILVIEISSKGQVPAFSRSRLSFAAPFPPFTLPTFTFPPFTFPPFVSRRPRSSASPHPSSSSGPSPAPSPAPAN